MLGGYNSEMGVTAATCAAGLAIANIKSQSMGGACRNWRLRIGLRAA
jgi:hypothetical protein